MPFLRLAPASGLSGSDPTAKETCQELDRKYPLTEPGPGSKDCFERAKDDGMKQAQDAIRMAKRQPVAVETD